MIEFNPQDPSYITNPYPVLRRLRNEAPLYFWEQAGCWLITRYDDICEVIKDDRLSTDMKDWQFYSAGEDKSTEEMKEIAKSGLFQLKRDDHSRVRKIVRSAFTPSAARRKAGLIKETIRGLIDEANITKSKRFDLFKDLAELMPIRVIGRIIGIPRASEAKFREWSDALVKLVDPRLTPEEVTSLRALLPGGYQMVGELIKERRQTPADDLLTDLIAAEVEGQKLSDPELLAMVAWLIVGGSETTGHLLTFTVNALLRFPDVQDRVRADSSLIPGLIEEVSRFDNYGLMGVPRYVLESIEVRGVKLEKGTMVVCMLGAAMHDESVWPDAEDFIIDRPTVRNISFGRGPHFCLGAYLAKEEVKAAVEVLFELYGKLERAGDPVFEPHPIIRTFASLPVQVADASA